MIRRITISVVLLITCLSVCAQRQGLGYGLPAKVSVRQVEQSAEPDSGPIDVIYGYLYNWFAVSDAKNVANTGWHVPTKANYQTLATNLGGTDGGGYYSNIGAGLRETGTTYWNSGTGTTNAEKFNGRGAGGRVDYDGIYSGLKGSLNLWTSESNATFFMLISGYLGFDYMTQNKKYGMSLRLIKDATTLTDGQEGTYTGNDGKVYRTICIVDQEWLADNLCENKFRDGTLISVVTSDAQWAALTTSAVCYYDNTITNAYTLPN